MIPNKKKKDGNKKWVQDFSIENKYKKSKWKMNTTSIQTKQNLKEQLGMHLVSIVSLLYLEQKHFFFKILVKSGQQLRDFN